MLYAAKCYWPGVNETEFEPIAARATNNNSRGARHGAKYLGSLLFRDDELVLCTFAASSPSAVKRASERVGIPCERVMDSVWLEPRPATEKGSSMGPATRARRAGDDRTKTGA
jgi:hypothetical protein